MLQRRRLQMLGMLTLMGVSMAGYAYATSCGGPPVEVLNMQLISVTYDGTLQKDPPEYFQVSGRLKMRWGGGFIVEYQQQGSNPPTTLQTEIFDAE
jgi:hypothetical protein